MTAAAQAKASAFLVASRKACPYHRHGSRCAPSAHSLQALMNTGGMELGGQLRRVGTRDTAVKLRLLGKYCIQISIIVMLSDERLIDHKDYCFAHPALFHGSPRYQHNLCIQTNSVVSTTEGRPAAGGTRPPLWSARSIRWELHSAPPDPGRLSHLWVQAMAEVDNGC
jgi:hypothetical protein